MSRTRRIYNRHLKKTQQYSADYMPERKGYGIMLGDIVGLPYHPYHQLCMGHCNGCRDPDLDQKHQRKIRARELRQRLREEAGYEVQETGSETTT